MLAPDVIVSDIVMPGLNGIAAAAEILRRNSAARIVLVTVHNDLELVQKGLATGALGYVLKLTAGDDLVPAIHAVLRGERHLSPTVVHASD
jgi:DNA-binding NarL/FixJ family response regulator